MTFGDLGGGQRWRGCKASQRAMMVVAVPPLAAVVVMVMMMLMLVVVWVRVSCVSLACAMQTEKEETERKIDQLPLLPSLLFCFLFLFFSSFNAFLITLDYIRNQAFLL